MARWKDIPGYEGLYQISNMGKVKSLARMVDCCYNSQRIEREKILKTQVSRDGYSVVNLYCDSKMKTKYVARMVAIAFVPNPNSLPEVNHRFGKKEDNRASQLEWCTSSENKIHAFQTGLMKGRRGKENSLSKPIIQTDMMGNFIKLHLSIKEAERETGICNVHITDVAKGKKYYHSAGGFGWKYATI